MKFLSIIAIACVMALTSCKKDTVTSNKDLLTGGSSKSWLTTKITLTNSAGVTADVTSTFLAAACDKDDFVTFKSDGVYLEDEGALKCTASNPQSVAGTFTLNAAETEVTIKNASSTQLSTISSLSTTQFVSVLKDPNFGTFTVTMVAK